MIEKLKEIYEGVMEKETRKEISDGNKSRTEINDGERNKEKDKCFRKKQG